MHRPGTNRHDHGNRRGAGYALTVAPLFAVLVSCGGGGGGNPGQAASAPSACVSITGGATRAEQEIDCSSVSPCGVVDPHQAADGDLETQATIVIALNGGTVRLRVTAQPGLVYPAGTRVGLVMRKYNNAVCAVRTLTLETYLGEQAVDQFAIDPAIANPPPSLETRERDTVAFTASSAFDRVELAASSLGCWAQSDGTAVHEFCANP